MSYTQKVKDLQNQIADDIKSFLKEKDIQEASFNWPFKIFVSVMHDYNEFGYEPCTVTSILHDGTAISDCEELLIGELDIYELSHIFDTLNKGEYKIVAHPIDH